ncbi:hypothetical protein BH24PSE2_BH24PSE2_20890 [soil metagenome]
MARPARKTEKFNLRATREQMAMLRAAAELKRQDVTAFLLGAATDAAEQALADRTHFPLSAAQHRAFLTALDRPVQKKPRLRRLMSGPSVIERE